MRALVQRVTEASVTVDGAEVGRITKGLCVFVGVTHTDDERTATNLADKVWNLRILEHETALADDPPNANVLVVSQFTLYADTSRGRRPSWSAAARPEHAEPLVDGFAQRLRDDGAHHVATGRFRAHMHVALVNDGPVTVLLEA